MKPFRAPRSKAVFIELIPLIDVIFVLLLFFMLTASFSNPAVDLQLPKGRNTHAPEAKNVTVSLKADGALFVNGEAVSRAELEAVIEREHRGGAISGVVLQGDRLVRYEELFSLIDFLKSAGIEKISLSHRAGE